MLYRIHTEDRNRPSVEAIVVEECSEYTILLGDGSWKGNREKTLVIEIVGEMLAEKIRRIAEKIKAKNGQESVFVQEIPNSSYLV